MRQVEVRSSGNPKVRRFMKILARPEKYAPRAGHPSGEVIVEGAKITLTALEAGAVMESVLVTRGFLEERRNAGLIASFSERTIPLSIVEEGLLRRISDTERSQGIIALCRVRCKGIEEVYLKGDEIIVVSDGIQDPGNMGTIVRLTDAAGSGYVVVLTGSVNPYSPKAIRSSAGSVFNIDILFAGREDFLKWCDREDVQVVFTGAGAETTVYGFNALGRMAVVFGNEGSGVSDKIRDAADTAISIPIPGKAESLNVASAAAVVLYEIVRRRGKVH